MKFSKTRNVKSPTRANSTDAGIDFFVPKIDDEFFNLIKEKNSDPGANVSFDDSKNVVLVHPGGRVLIPSGIKTIVPNGFALVAFNKSGIASKFGLVHGACVVDSGYRAEIDLNLINTSKEAVKIKENMKILQFLLLPIDTSLPEEITDEEYSLYTDTTRGTGGFGSTGI
jgi:dUTP pyrophosphatase